MPFQPVVNQQLDIDGVAYRLAEHPHAPGMVYGQEGRQAVVYQLLAGTERRALKVFKPRFRLPAITGIARRLEPLAVLPGLQVCRRTVLTPQQHSRLLGSYPDLTYAVLMPWVPGPTWLEVLLARQPLKPTMSYALARGLAGVLVTMEQDGLAHCDLSGANLLLPDLASADRRGSMSPVALVDVEQMYGPELRRPELLPGGSSGYAHRSAADGLWSSSADRFAGTMLLAEMLGWCDQAVPSAAWGENYFDPAEMQEHSPRYEVLAAALQTRWGTPVADLFTQAWDSATLADCPTFGEWAVVLAEQAPIPVRPPVADPGMSPEYVIPLPPDPREAAARALIDLAQRFVAQGNLSSALDAYRQAEQVASPESALAWQIAAAIRDLPAAPQAATTVSSTAAGAPVSTPVRQTTLAPGEPVSRPHGETTGSALESLFDEGFAAYKRRERERARELLAEVVRRDPNYTRNKQSARGLLAKLEPRTGHRPILFRRTPRQAGTPARTPVQKTEQTPDTLAGQLPGDDTNSTLERLFDEGFAAYKQGERERARELLAEVVRRDPNYTRNKQQARRLLARLGPQSKQLPWQSLRLSRPAAFFWMVWVLANTAAGAVGFGLAPLIIGYLRLSGLDGADSALWGATASGLLVAAQGLVLRKKIPRLWGWLLIGIAGGAAVAAGVWYMPLPLPWILWGFWCGVVSSLMQWWGLRAAIGLGTWRVYIAPTGWILGGLLSAITIVTLQRYGSYSLTTATLNISILGATAAVAGAILLGPLTRRLHNSAPVLGIGRLTWWQRAVIALWISGTLCAAGGLVWAVQARPCGWFAHYYSGDCPYTVAGEPQGLWSARFSREGYGIISNVQTLAFTQDGRTLVAALLSSALVEADGSGFADAYLRIIDGGWGTCSYCSEPVALSDAASLLAYVPSGYATLPKILNLRSSGDLPKLSQPRAGAAHVTALAFTLDQQILAAGLADGTTLLWQTTDGSPLPSLEAPEQGEVRALALGPTRWAAAASRGTVYIWDVRIGQLLVALPAPDQYSAVRDLAFSPDGSPILAVAYDSHPVQVWDLQNLDAAYPLHTFGYASRLAFSPDGQTLATAHFGDNVEIWNVATGQRMSYLVTREGSAVTSLSYAPGGRTLAAGTDDGTIQFWTVPLPGP